jgi:hypothetical protein
MSTIRLETSHRYLKVTMLLLASCLSAASVMAADGNSFHRTRPSSDQASAFQGGYIIPAEKVVGSVIGARERKTFFGAGDTLYIRFIRNIDVRPGDWVTAYTMTNAVFHPLTKAYMGRLVKIIGILEITSEPKDRVAEARVIQPLDALKPGDPVMLYDLPAEVPEAGRSDEPISGAIVESQEGGELTAQGEIVYIDLGAHDGLEVGDRLKVIRRGNRESMKTFLPDYALAELKVLSVQQRSATTMIMKSLDAVRLGDLVTRLLRRPSAPVQDPNAVPNAEDRSQEESK